MRNQKFTGGGIVLPRGTRKIKPIR